MKYSIILYFAFVIPFISCSSELIPTDIQKRPQEIFDEFWTYVNEHYIYFNLKDVDWNEVYENYSQQIDIDMNEENLYQICHRALLELKDGHNRIATPEFFIPSYNFKEGYDIHFSVDLIYEKYAQGKLEQSGNLYYGTLNNDIGYIYISEMNKYGNLPSIVRKLDTQGIEGLVIDVRNNGGGDSNSIPGILGDFVKEKTTLGYYLEKSGPGHLDITEPLEAEAIPSDDFYFDLPVDVISNRDSFSAASYLAAMFGALSNVTLVGQITGGGGGGNYGYQLSNGWIVAVSVSDYLDTNMNSIEPGVSPDVIIENTAERLEAGHDDMIEKAMHIITNY